MIVLNNLKSLEKLILKRKTIKNKITKKVEKILKDVKEHGDEALIYYTKKFDKVKLSLKELRISESEISAAFDELDSETISSFKIAIENVIKFYKKDLPKLTRRIKESNGKILIKKYIPLERVGIYIPAGTSPLVSSVYMSVIPAIVAGVKEIVLVSPPNKKDNSINPYILSIASLLKIKEIYRIGGAQAIAALGYGTQTIKKVDKIIGPGNEYVTEAKRQIFGEVDIDMLAGPSEVVILALRGANIDYIALDLGAQMEHNKGLGILITNSKKIIAQLQNKKIDCIVLKVNCLEEAIEAINRIAPEHLEIFSKKPSKILKHIRNAAGIFLGEYSPVALGDYTAGPSHILPTNGTARFFSTLSVREFLKEVHIISYTKKAIFDEVNVLEKIASIEGMSKHIESVKKRLVDYEKKDIKDS